MVSCESLGLLERAFDVCFQNTRKSSRWQRELRLRLDDKECLFPGPNHSSEKQQAEPICLLAGRSFDLPIQDDELLPQQRVFDKQFGLAFGKVCDRFQQKGGKELFDA